MSGPLLRPFLGFLLFVLSAAAARAEEMPLVAHHATYKLTLAKSDGRKAPAGANGYIKYEFAGSSCDGYTTTFRQLTSLEPPEGESRVSESLSTTFENGEASLFRFDTKTKLNGADDDNVVGHASKAAGGLSVGIDQPTADTVTLAVPALFPTEHLKKVIATGKNGGKIFSVPVFDGSGSGKKIYNTLSIIGSAITTPASDAADLPADMKAMPRWPVTISFFEDGSNETQPIYVLTFELYENGVSRALMIDYGDFALAGELIEFKVDPVTPCHS